MSIQCLRSANYFKREPIRISNWWNYLLTFLLGIGFYSIYIFEIPFNSAIQILGLLFVTITGTIAFGYFINDWSDIEIDRIAGKRNTAAKNTFLKNSLIVSFLLLVSLIPWIFLPKSASNVGFYILQLFLLMSYSLPPLRIKRHKILCVITDALYNSAIPFLVIFFTFHTLSDFNIQIIKGAILFISIWAFLKGLRGILLHQIADRKNDRKTSITTFVNHYGSMRSFNLIWRILFPIEIVLFISTLMFLTLNYFKGLWIVIPVFVIYLILFLRLWERNKIRNYQFKLSIVYIINDLYEEWLPVVFLGYLSMKNPWFLMVMVLYFLLFNEIVVKWYHNTRKNIRNLKDLLVFIQWKLGLAVKNVIN